MKERMIDLLLSEPIGRIVVCNIIAALEENVIESDTLKAFLGNCVQAFTEDEVTTTKELVVQFEHVARGDRPRTSGRRRKFLLACTKRTPAITNRKKFSTVLAVSAVKKHLVSDSASLLGHASFGSNPDPTDPVLKDAIDRLNGRTDIYRPNARLGSNPYRPLFWIVPTKLLSTERQNNSLENLGNAVRDRLGLIDYEENIPLVEIRIPGNRLQRRRHARPTIADAGSHRRFRIYPDASRSKQRSGWGWTVHLGRFARGDTIIDGAPERVVEPTDFNARLGAKLEFAGVTKTARGSIGDDDDATFAKRVCCGANRRSLKTFLLDILS